MAARRARHSKKKGGAAALLLILGGVGVAALIALLGSGVLRKSSVRGLEPTAHFRIADYRKDGSRFASAGNSYVFDGRVENIETIGNDRVVCISLADNPDERLPLLVPAQVNLRGVNLTRNDRFIFQVSCRTGTTPEGEQVRGVLVVNKVEIP